MLLCSLRLLAFIGVLLLTAHDTTSPVNALETEHLKGRWELTFVNGRPIPVGRRAHFQIDGTQFQGFDGCNSFGGRLDQPKMLVMSQRACADGMKILPLDLRDPWRQLKTAIISNDRLVVDTCAGKTEFTRAR